MLQYAIAVELRLHQFSTTRAGSNLPLTYLDQVIKTMDEKQSVQMPKQKY
jgi:hypothetical protein